MKISVFGIGHVGAVIAACLARDGHDIVVVDTDPAKVAAINERRSPIVEPGLQELIADAIKRDLLRATPSVTEATSHGCLSIVCVGSPSNEDNSVNLEYLDAVCRELGAAIRQADQRHTILVRSTVLPGTMRGVVIPTIETISGKKAGLDFGIGFSPEFLREGSAISDYYDPPKRVLGVLDDTTADLLEDLFAELPGPLFRTTLEVAEMVKFADNSWHALKVAYANEIGSICKACGIDGHAVMDIFCQDRKLNISTEYLRPGFAFGGSCLPKDVRALSHYAESLHVEAPVLDAILPSNQAQIQRGI